MHETDVTESITIDEVGLATARLGDFRLSTLYQPIFVRDRGLLVPSAVAGTLATTLDGCPIPSRVLFDSVASDDWERATEIGRLLHMRNFEHVGAENLALFVDPEGAAADPAEPEFGEVRFLARRQVEPPSGFDLPSATVFETFHVGGGDFSAISGDLARRGIVLSRDGTSAIAAAPALRPDIAKLDAGWLARLDSFPGSLRLLSGFVASLRRNGVAVHVESIVDPDHLRIALSLGARYFQGALLAPPLPAGAYFDLRPLAIDVLVTADPKVVPLRRGA